MGSEDARCVRAGAHAAAARFGADTTVLVVLGVALALLAAVPHASPQAWTIVRTSSVCGSVCRLTICRLADVGAVEAEPDAAAVSSATYGSPRQASAHAVQLCL